MEAIPWGAPHDRERARLATALTALGLVVAPSVGNFLFVDIGRPAAPVAEALPTHGGIIKAWGEDGYTNCSRVSLGTPEDNDLFRESRALLLDRKG